MVLAFLLHASTLSHPFLSDDCAMIQYNPTLASTSPAVPFRLFGMDYWSQIDARGRVYHAAVDRNLYRPAVLVSYWLNARLTGVTPAGFRAVNILLHGATAAAAGLLAAAWLNPAAGGVAAAGVLLHPAATDIINRIVGRADLLVLLGICLFFLADHQARRRGWSGGLAALALLAGAMALGAKESGLVLLPLCLCHVALDPAPARKGDRRRWVGPAIALALTVIYLVARRLVAGSTPYAAGQGGDLTSNPLQGEGLAGRLAPGFSLAFYYARLLVWPRPLMAMDRPPALPGWGSPAVWLGVALLAGAVAFGIHTLVRPRTPRKATAAMGVVWWVFSFAVVGQILSPIGTYREVRLCYPFLGALAFGLALAWAAIGTGPLPAWRRALRLLPGLLLAAFATLTLIRNGDFSSESAMYQADLAANPRAALPRMIAGMLHWNAGRMEDARRELEEAVRLAPASSEAHCNLGRLSSELGDSTGAEMNLRRALELDARNAVALLHLGSLRLQQGKWEEAWRLLLESERQDPESVWTQIYLAQIEASRGQFDSALRRIDRVASRAPGDEQIAGLRRSIEAMKSRAGAPDPFPTRGADD